MRLLKLIAMAASVGLLQCSSGGGEGNVGSICLPTSESNFQFAGYSIKEESIVTNAPECGGGVCLVNHFQGRVSCPLGQEAPTPCSGPGDSSCGFEQECVVAGRLKVDCDPDASGIGCGGFGGTCDAKTLTCICNQTADCPSGTFCDAETQQCTSFVCHGGSADCQVAGSDDNQGKACCVPGTIMPVATPVCGQCAESSSRDAESAVYCSCKCGPAEGTPDEGGYCDCPAGFECKETRPYIGLGDPKLAGKYCIKQGSEYKSEQECGGVKGFFSSSQCDGVSAP